MDRQDNQRRGEYAAFLTELALREQAVKQGEEEAIRATLGALKNWDTTNAEQWFKLTLGWNQLHKMVSSWTTNSGREGSTYVVDAWFLETLIAHLTPGADEEITYVTGVMLGKVKVLSRLCALELQEHSPVYALAKAQSCSDVLAEILEKGNRLHVMAHSHPGKGAAGTRPSGIDLSYLGRIQRNGADVVGIIVTRDGFVRFFSVEKPFRVVVQGNGVSHVEENVYQITLSHKDRLAKNRRT